MDETLITLRHADYPGAFYFRGYISEEHFLRTHVSFLGELELGLFDKLICLPITECEIIFTRARNALSTPTQE